MNKKLIMSISIYIVEDLLVIEIFCIDLDNLEFKKLIKEKCIIMNTEQLIKFKSDFSTARKMLNRFDSSRYIKVAKEDWNIIVLKFEKQLDTLNARINVLEAENAEQKVKIITMGNRILELEAENAELKAKVVTMGNRILELEAENTELKSKVITMGNRILELEAENTELKDRLSKCTCQNK